MKDIWTTTGGFYSRGEMLPSTPHVQQGTWGFRAKKREGLSVDGKIIKRKYQGLGMILALTTQRDSC